MKPHPITIDVISDVVCPFCYLGKKQLEAAIQLAGGEVAVRWKPFQLDASIPKEGLDRAAYMQAKFGSKERLAAIHDQLKQAGAQAGISFRFDKITRSPNTRDAHRLLAWAQAQGAQDSLVDILFRFYFEEGRDIGDRSVLAEAAAIAGLPRTEAEAFLAGNDGNVTLDEYLAQAHALGVTGVPTFVIDSRYGVVGAQGAEQIAGAIAQARSD